MAKSISNIDKNFKIDRSLKENNIVFYDVRNCFTPKSEVVLNFTYKKQRKN